MDAPLKSLGVLFNVLGCICYAMASIAPMILSSVYCLQTSVNRSTNFTKFAVGPKCHMLYQFSECATVTGTNQISNLCTFVQFPNQPQVQLIGECGCLLLNQFYSLLGKIMYP